MSLPGIRLRPNSVSKGDKSSGIVDKFIEDEDAECGHYFVDVDELVFIVSLRYAIGTKAPEMVSCHDKLTP